jgi:hypothetical protein
LNPDPKFNDGSNFGSGSTTQGRRDKKRVKEIYISEVTSLAHWEIHERFYKLTLYRYLNVSLLKVNG